MFVMRRLFLTVAVFFVVELAVVVEAQDIFALCRKGTPSEIMTAVKGGADINAKDKDGRTPLMIAAMFNKDPDVITVLVNLGADIGAQDKNGENAFALSAKNPNGEIKASLTSFGGVAPVKQNIPNVTATKTQEVLKIDAEKFIELCQNGTSEQVQAAINGGSRVNANNSEGWTVLALAARYSTPDVLETLLRNGADVNAKNTKNAGSLTALFTAVRRNTSPEKIKILIKHGIDVNAKDADGSTALMYAARYNTNPEIVRVLIAAGANVNEKNKNGQSIFDFAKDNENASAVRAALTELVNRPQNSIASVGSSPVSAQTKQATSSEFEAKLAAAKKGNAIAQTQVAEMYLTGNGTTRDPSEAVHWYKQAAEKGNIEAQVNLAELYMKGEGCSKDYEKARELLLVAAKKGHKVAARLLGNNYAVGGDGAKKDLNETVYWYRKAADAGDIEANIDLAECFFNGLGVSKDFARGVSLAMQAAEQGKVRAFALLAGAYSDEESGANIDYAKSMEYRKKVIEIGEREVAGGNLHAEYWLMLAYAGAYFTKIDGMKANDDEGLFASAIKWGIRAGEHGNREAYYEIGDLYSTLAQRARIANSKRGNYSSLPEQYHQAKHYFQLAAAMGHKGAAMALNNIENMMKKMAEREY